MAASVLLGLENINDFDRDEILATDRSAQRALIVSTLTRPGPCGSSSPVSFPSRLGRRLLSAYSFRTHHTPLNRLPARTALLANKVAHSVVIGPVRCGGTHGSWSTQLGHEASAVGADSVCDFARVAVAREEVPNVLVRSWARSWSAR